MDAATFLDRRAQYFVVRHCARPSRAEFRNVAVALISESGDYAQVKHLPPSQLAANVREQGILDAALVGIGRVVGHGGAAAIDRLMNLGTISSGSLQVGSAMPADLGSHPNDTLNALFKSLVALRTSRPRGIQKTELLDRVVNGFRQSGAPIRRGEYMDDFLMDAVVLPDEKKATAVLVESFASSGRDWSRVERGAGYFLYALEQLGVEGIAVVQEPNESSDDDARRSHHRVDRWLNNTGLPYSSPADLAQITRRFAKESEQLPLMMA